MQIIVVLVVHINYYHPILFFDAIMTSQQMPLLELSTNQITAAHNITNIYQTLIPENVVSKILPPDKVSKEWAHYPANAFRRDLKNHTQFYYHSHPSTDPERVPEHGHFHIFLRKPRFKDHEQPLAMSKKYRESKGEKDNLTHLVAIAMNEYGLPSALFTVNHWVVEGIWFNATRIAQELDTFVLEIENSPYSLVNAWITNIIALFKPYIIELLKVRDEVLAETAREQADKNVFQNKSLEVTSVLKLQMPV